MEYQLVGTLICVVCAISALITATYGIIIIKAMERSTHTVTWQPLNDPSASEIAKANDEYNKKVKEAVEFEELGF